MTREEINKCFAGDLGLQLEVLYETPQDEQVFIRYEEAVLHSELYKFNKEEIVTWWREEQQIEDHANIK